jgi:hypothetical protein
MIHSYSMGFIQFTTNILYIISVYNKECNFKHILHNITPIKWQKYVLRRQLLNEVLY